jgi:hypothetical protein
VPGRLAVEGLLKLDGGRDKVVADEDELESGSTCCVDWGGMGRDGGGRDGGETEEETTAERGGSIRACASGSKRLELDPGLLPSGIPKLNGAEKGRKDCCCCCCGCCCCCCCCCCWW